MTGYHKRRVAVPLALRTAVLALGTRDQACAIMNIGQGTWAELVDPNGTLPETTIKRIQAALERQRAS